MAFQSAENNLAPTHLNGDGDKGADVPPKVRAGDAAGALRGQMVPKSRGSPSRRNSSQPGRSSIESRIMDPTRTTTETALVAVRMAMMSPPRLSTPTASVRRKLKVTTR